MWYDNDMKKRLIAALFTITTFGFVGGGPAWAQDDAGAAAALVAPAPEESENAPTATETGSEVAASEGETKAAESDGAEQGPVETGGDMYAAIRAGKWIAATGFGLVLLVGVIKKLGPEFIKGRRAGYVMGYGIPMVAALGLSMSSGIWSIEVFLGALAVGQSGAAWHSNSQDIKRETVG